MTAAQLAERATRPILAPPGGALVPWLIAVASLGTIAVLLVDRPVVRAPVAPAPVVSTVPPVTAPLSPRQRARAAVEALGRMTPYTSYTAAGLGYDEGRCSIYSDGNLERGRNVSWIATLCFVTGVLPQPLPGPVA
jgi:hypothetical protein